MTMNRIRIEKIELPKGELEIRCTQYPFVIIGHWMAIGGVYHRTANLILDNNTLDEPAINRLADYASSDEYPKEQIAKLIRDAVRFFQHLAVAEWDVKAMQALEV